ncbi:ABC transporter permease [Metabacillus halosaccharovorans]|uniref:ABC transporter permease n=1 Tax=Metabacillus halosaccharovorans TaxID=930124 RepID=UPI000994B3F3|nr:ABC transporter permease subunit [Metabacillus halosaccharovorans]
MIKVLKNPLFLIGFLFIIGLLMTSFIYTAIVNSDVRQIQLLYDNNGDLLASSPISPRWGIPFGTDLIGYDMLSKVLIGAKYTLLAAISIAALRILISIPFGLILGSYLSKFTKYLNSIIDIFHFIPLSLIALYLLSPVLYSSSNGFEYSLTERIVIEVIVLTVLAVPVLALLIGNETNELFKEEFVISSKIMGGSKLHIIRKHIFPLLKARFWILFGQQITQTLLVMVHLGLFNLYFGGTVITYGDFADPPKSMTNEWSGLIGGTKNYIRSAPWIPLTPIICFALTILAVTLMIEGYNRVSTGKSLYVIRKKDKKNNTESSRNRVNTSKFKFQRYNQ